MFSFLRSRALEPDVPSVYQLARALGRFALHTPVYGPHGELVHAVSVRLRAQSSQQHMMVLHLDHEHETFTHLRTVGELVRVMLDTAESSISWRRSPLPVVVGGKHGVVSRAVIDGLYQSPDKFRASSVLLHSRLTSSVIPVSHDAAVRYVPLPRWYSAL